MTTGNSSHTTIK